MNDEATNSAPDKSLFKRISQAFSQTPRNSEDVADMLRSAENESIIDASVLQIMEGALKVSDQQAREIMIPRSQMVIIEDDFTVEKPIDWSIFTELEGYEWDLCLMSHNSLHEHFSDIMKPLNIGREHFIRPTFFYNTHTYLLSSGGIKKLIEDHLDVLKQNIIVSDEFLSAVTSSHPRPDLREMYITNMSAVATKVNYTGQTRSEGLGNSLTETEK